MKPFFAAGKRMASVKKELAVRERLARALLPVPIPG